MLNCRAVSSKAQMGNLFSTWKAGIGRDEQPEELCTIHRTEATLAPSGLYKQDQRWIIV